MLQAHSFEVHDHTFNIWNLYLKEHQHEVDDTAECDAHGLHCL